MKTEKELKQILKSLEKTPNFEIYFTGKSSKKINGLYKPESKEIYINNRNFDNDNDLILTTIHEFAHHVQNTVYFMKTNPHDTQFWFIYHGLLNEAEHQGIYENDCYTENKDDYQKLIRANIEFNSAMQKFFKEVETFRMSMVNKDNQYSDCMHRIMKFKKNEIVRMSNSAYMPSPYHSYNTTLKLSSKKKIDPELFHRLHFPLIPKFNPESISIEQFEHLTKDEKFTDELSYWNDKKEKAAGMIEKSKEKVESLAYKIKKIIERKSK